MHLSCYTQNLLTDHLWRSATWSKTTARWFALFSAAPADTGGGTELSGNGYARAQFDASDAHYYATQGGISGASSGTVSPSRTENVTSISFPAPTGDWLMASWFGVYDAPTGGNLIGWDALTEPVTVFAGDSQVQFAGGSFVFTVD
jgi:hypothetical protein